jgi:hypothetical protein
MIATSAKLDDSSSTEQDSVFAGLTNSAKVEFQASLQLLAERAMFLLGSASVAIALRTAKGPVAYCANAGACKNVPGAEVPSSNESAHECLRTGKIVRKTLDAAEDKFQLFVPVKNEHETIGFFELVSRFEFHDCDGVAVERLAELVSTAWEQNHAALDAQSRLLERSSALAEAAAVVANGTEAEEIAREVPKPAGVDMPSFSSCSSCGFPVSPGRTLCVDCEQKIEPAPAKPAELFAIAKQESWISTHGYTIASAVVTILAVAIILWLRR